MNDRYPAAARREALLIEMGLDDCHVLAGGARAGMDVAAFGGADDGLVHLVRRAAGRERYDALHLVCHGAPGRLMLGTRTLDGAALHDPAVRDALAAIGHTLRPGGCVLLYACDAAAGRAGADFVAALARALGVPVAAPTGRLGGGSWALDHATGPLSAAPLVWPDYAHALTIASTTTTFSTIPAGVNTNYGTVLAPGYGTPATLGQTDIAGTGWDVSAQSSNAASSFVIRGIGAAGNGDGDSSALRFQASDVDSVTFKSNAGGFYFDLDAFALRNAAGSTGTVQALDGNGQPVGAAVAFSIPASSTAYSHISLAGNADFRGIFGFEVAFTSNTDAPFFDNVVVANIGIPAAPTTTVAGASLSADSATAGDFVTNTAAQTISGTLSAPLAGGDKVEVSYDGGAHWSDATGYTAGSSAWSTTATLSGSGTFEARVTNAYGSGTAYSHAYTLDATAPAGLALSATTVAPAGAGSGAAVGTLSATDATAVTYALAAGDGTNDADNGSFAIAGNTLGIGGAALPAGTYHVYLAATDAAGNVGNLAATITVQGIPGVASIVRAGGAAAGVAAAATSVDYTVTFSESVTGVDAGDFTLGATGTAGGTVAAVSGSGTTYTITVNGLAGDGTLRLDLNGAGTGIRSGAGVAVGGGYTAGQTFLLDHTAPAAPSSLGTGSIVTADTTPVVTGSAENGSAVALYDTDGTTILGTATATGGAWTIAASALGEGTHSLTAKAVDAAGNVSPASAALAMTVDTTAPAHVALSATTVAVTGAAGGAAIGTLSATDATGVTYALAAGNGTNDADNARFAIAGSTLAVGGAALAAGTYHVYLAATDAAGNVGNAAETITVANVPAATSIVRAGSPGVAADAGSVDYTVTFSEDVTGVDAADFTLAAGGTAAGGVSAVSGSGTTWTVSVNGLSGDGTLRLDLNGAGTGIRNGSGIAIATGYTAGQAYLLDHSAPAAPSAPDLAAAGDSGASDSDDVTASSVVTLSGTAESGATVVVVDSDGTTVLGSTTASGGTWSLAAALAEGVHHVGARALDAAGNTSAPSAQLTVTVDRTAPAGVALSADTVAASGAGSGAAIGTLSATDATAVTYALAAGDGSNDADDGRFAIAGNALSVGESALAAGTYHVYVAATDAAGNVSHQAETITVHSVPAVASIVRAGGQVPADAASATYTVTFSEDVTGVDAADFALASTGSAAGRIADIGGSGSTYAVTVDGLAGDGTLRLDLNAAGTGIRSANGVAIATGYASGQAYTLDHTAPAAPSAPVLQAASDTGVANDGITNAMTPRVDGVADANAVVRLYDGATLVAAATADDTGRWTIESTALAAGTHVLTARQLDAAGNVSAASAGLSVTIDTSAAAPAIPLLATDSDSGIAGDGVTRAATPVLGGSAEAFATVKLYDSDGTTVLGTATAGADGAWHITSGALADGAHALTVRQTDVAGNVSAASAALDLTVDTMAPAAPTLAPGDGFRGNGEAHAAITVYDGATVLGTATADGAGDWSITPAALAPGRHRVTATQADAAGNVSAASTARDILIADPPAPAAPTIDGVQVSQAPVALPGGGAGTATTIPIVTSSRVDTTGSAAVADIPLASNAGATTLLAQVGVGFGLTASGGATEQLVQAIVAATPDHAAVDQAHLTGNGLSFLGLLPAQSPLLVQTVVPVTAPDAAGATLTLTGTSTPAQHTALVIDAGHVGAGNTVALQAVDFAAVIGAATVTGNTRGQILTGDAAGQTFIVGAGLESSLFAGAGDDTLRLTSAAAPGGAAAAVHADGSGAATLMHGGLGADIAAFAGNRSAYTIAWHEGHEVVTANGGAHEQAIVVNAETLRFADGDVAVGDRADLSAIAGLYATVLGRQADVGGMDFWGGWEKSGATLGQVALAMLATTEGQGRHAAFDGDAAHDVGVLYEALFGRAADAAGLAYWTDIVHKGATLEQVADRFMHSTEIVGHALAATEWDFQM